MLTGDMYEYRNSIEDIKMLLHRKTERERATIYYEVCRHVKRILVENKSKEGKPYEALESMYTHELEEVNTYLTVELKKRTTTKARSEGLQDLLDYMVTERDVGDKELVTTSLRKFIEYKAH